MKRLLCLLLVLSLCPSLLPAARGEEGGAGEERPEYTSRSRVTSEYFSTVSMLQIFDDFRDPARVEAFEETWREVTQLLAELDAALSLSGQDSDVSRFNALRPGETAGLSPCTQEILTISREVYELSGGLYDPTVASLVDLFGFTPRFSLRNYRPQTGYDREKVGGVLPLPRESDVQALQSLTGFSSVRFSDGQVEKTAEPVPLCGQVCQQTIDLGGIGKGYAVDRVLALLREKGYAYGYFSCGGSSIGILSRATASKGAPEAAQWGVGIQYPRFTDRQETLLRVFTKDRALSTSGDYEHAYLVDGVRYSHLIDPRTGWPVNMPKNGVQSGLCSVTVLGESAAYCDALSTALFVMGPLAAVSFMNREDMAGFSYVMIGYRDGADRCEIITNLSEKQYELLDPDRFSLCSALDGGGRVQYTGEFFREAE